MKNVQILKFKQVFTGTHPSKNIVRWNFFGPIIAPKIVKHLLLRTRWTKDGIGPG